MNTDILKFIKKPLYILFSLSLLLVSTSTTALPFSIVPKAGTVLPTQIRPGRTVFAYYTVYNNTIAPRSNNYVKYLPPNTRQVLTGGTYPDTCGSTFNLAGKGNSGDSCTLQLIISGTISNTSRNPHDHLFVCFPGGITCAGTQYPLIVTQVETKLNTAYITNFINYTVSACPIQGDGKLTSCATAYTGFAPPTAIALNPSSSYVYIADQSNLVSSCPLGVNGNIGTCTSGSLPNPSGIAINQNAPYAYITLLGLNFVVYCSINNNGTLNINSCNVTGGGFITPLGIAVNSTGTFAYVVNNITDSISSCSISMDGSLTNCISNPSPVLPYAIAINPANTFAYVTTSTDVYYCSINLNGTLNSCNSTGINTFNFPTAITFNQIGTYAYITNLTSNTVSLCPVNFDGTFGSCSDTGNGLDGPNGIVVFND